MGQVKTRHISGGRKGVLWLGMNAVNQAYAFTNSYDNDNISWLSAGGSRIAAHVTQSSSALDDNGSVIRDRRWC